MQVFLEDYVELNKSHQAPSGEGVWGGGVLLPGIGGPLHSFLVTAQTVVWNYTSV